MGSKTNRSLQRNHLKAKKQRQALGAIEGMKPAYFSDKTALRGLAAAAMHMVKPVIIEHVERDYTMVLYNPTIHRAPKALAYSCYVDCGDELVQSGR